MSLEHPNAADNPAPQYMTPGEVAQAFRVDPRTVTRWAKRGLLRSIRTPGGHRRFLTDDVTHLLNRFSDAERSPTGRA